MKNDRYCCTVLDHWVNYKERLAYEGITLTPNELWCFDSEALKIANKIFPKIPKKILANPYFAKIKKELDFYSHLNNEQFSAKESLDILYLSESIDAHSQILYRNSSQLFGYTERDAFGFFISCLPSLDFAVKSITVRPHPSQKQSDLMWMSSYVQSIKFEISNEPSLVEQIMSHDIVVGLDTMAMVVAILANKKVFCAIPPGFKKCSIPYPKSCTWRNLYR